MKARKRKLKKMGLILFAVIFLVVVLPLVAVKALAYTDDDLYNLEHLICGEAEGCSWDMKISVGSVVLNRVGDERFPNTIAEVIFQEGQYSCTWDGNFYKEPSSETKEAALYLLENGSQIDKSVVWQAEFIQGTGVYDVIGNMYFCY